MCYIGLASNENIDKAWKKIWYGVRRYWCRWVPDGWSFKSNMTVLVKADLCSIGPWLCVCVLLSTVRLCLLCSVSVYLVSPVCEIANVKPSFLKNSEPTKWNIFSSQHMQTHYMLLTTGIFHTCTHSQTQMPHLTTVLIHGLSFISDLWGHSHWFDIEMVMGKLASTVIEKVNEGMLRSLQAFDPLIHKMTKKFELKSMNLKMIVSFVPQRAC